MAMSPGTIVGGYRILKVLGAGGMGTVYLAKHPTLPRTDALKVLSGELSRNDEFRARFEREANLAAGLDHPNIVSVYNRGEEDGHLWIAMQYIEGTDASADLTQNPYSMSPLRALRIVTEVGKGLDYAHRKGLLHRDVKPANFLLSTSRDEEERVFLADFGVAKSSDDANNLTQTGSFVATIAYAPPEQLSGQSLDHRADIYSLACSFFKLLTGQNPYPASQPAMVMMGHLHEPPPRASVVRPGLPNAIDRVFAKAMAKNPAERFGSCKEFTAAAAAALTPGHHPVSTNTSPTYPVQVLPPDSRARAATVTGDIAPPLQPSNPRNGAGRRKMIAGAGAAALAAALAVGATVWITNSDAAPAPADAAASAGATDAAPVSRARVDNPAFQGKTVTVVDYQGPESVEVYYNKSPQAEFLQKLGFIYNLNLTQGNGQAARGPVEGRISEIADNPKAYLIVLRSDPQAGGGGLTGLPFDIVHSRSQVIAVDAPPAVSAMRDWSGRSEETLLDQLVPVLRQRIK